MSDLINSGLQRAGDVSIGEITLVSSSGRYISLQDYFVEMNLYESIYNNSLSGDIVISDSRNLVTYLPITGDELLIVSFETPSLGSTSNYGKINKTFRIYSIENRSIVRDRNTQVYCLKFVSLEAVVDSTSPIFEPYKGKPSEIVKTIFDKYLKTTRTIAVDSSASQYQTSEVKTELTVLDSTSNEVTFVTPGWTPMQTINWLAKKSIPKSGKACTFLFWETNKTFYFGTTEQLMDASSSVGIYTYSAYTTLNSFNTNDTYDVKEKMTLIDKIEIINEPDQLTNLNDGYLKSTVIDINLYNKKYEYITYDHSKEYNNYKHLNTSVEPLFNKEANIADRLRKVKLNPKYPKLFNNAERNVSERAAEIYGNRRSNIKDLNNLRMNITINGRTDIEAGMKITINVPDVSPADESKINQQHSDPRYSGNYLITSIHHKITGGINRHYMIMEVVKDGYNADTVYGY